MFKMFIQCVQDVQDVQDAQNVQIIVRWDLKWIPVDAGGLKIHCDDTWAQLNPMRGSYIVNRRTWVSLLIGMYAPILISDWVVHSHFCICPWPELKQSRSPWQGWLHLHIHADAPIITSGPASTLSLALVHRPAPAAKIQRCSSAAWDGQHELDTQI